MKTTLRALLSLTLALTLLVGNLTVFAVDGGSARDEIPYVAHDTAIADQTYDGNVTEYYGEEGIAAGVPEGFTDYVLKITPKSEPGHAGVCLDFGEQNIPIDSVESISFRIYIPSGGASEFRILNKAKASSWIVRETPSAFSSWVDVVLTESEGFMSGYDLTSLANADGDLGSFCILFRLKGSLEAGYIDAINIKYKSGASDDKTPPVLTYNGPTELTAREGEAFRLDGVSAFDEYDNVSATISYEWSAGALDGAGALKAGTHICTVKATDRTGNTATMNVTVTVKADNSLIRFDKIPYIPHDTSIADQVYDGKVSELSSAAAASEGVSEGYNGSVYKIEYSYSQSYVGVCLDFSEYEIPINLIESISFNILMPTSYSELRMRNGNADDWLMRCSSAPTGAWNTVVMRADGLNFYSPSKMSDLSTSDGTLGSFCLIGRNSGSYKPYYIDDIVIKLKDDDNTAPVLNYSGKTDILTSAGKPFDPGITAYDKAEDRELEIEYAWSEGALDKNGNMLEGVHTCVVSATNYFGHTASITLNVTVGPPDVLAPEIQFTASEIHVPVGTYNRMVISCVDDYDEVDVVAEWSEGTVDLGSRLLKGVHTLTLTAIDLTGNKSVHVVTVYVTDEDVTVGELIECGK